VLLHRGPAVGRFVNLGLRSAEGNQIVNREGQFDGEQSTRFREIAEPLQLA